MSSSDFSEKNFKWEFKFVFLAVQDSSIGDLVTQSVSDVLIERLLRDFERLLRDF